MSDLNELAKFEADLKNLIEIRNNFKPTYTESYNRDELNKIENEMHSQQLTLMCIPEHGKTTRMVVPEHGQPYNFNNVVTYMGVPEHGQPYKETNYYNMNMNTDVNSYSKLIQNNNINSVTKMGISEHGRPFVNKNKNN